MLPYLEKVHRMTSPWSGIIGSYSKALAFFVRRKLFGTSITSAHYKGLRFYFRDIDLSPIDETLVRGEYDLILPVLKKLAAPVIVDVGMNIGDFAILALAHNPSSRITGLEADEKTARLARKNGNLNAGRTWSVHHRAAWKNGDTVYLETGGASASNKISKSGKVPVQGIDLETVWTLLPAERVDVMKIDIEGAEEAFLFSQPEYLDKIDHLILEIHPLACDEQKIRDLLHTYFPVVMQVSGRRSSKRLLHCHGRNG